MIEPKQTKKFVQYLDKDVLTMAKERIKDLISRFDHLWVAYSGGKDSLVLMELVEEVYRELGMTEKVNVLFRDEELVQTQIIDFVRAHAESGRFNFRYLAVPMKVGKFIMGKHYPFVAWDKNRVWHRDPPPYAEMDLPNGLVADENNMDGAVFHGYSGRVCVMMGVRADESLKRYQSCTAKVVDNYISRTKAKHVWTSKPIYDWSEGDIFKYMYERGIPYCPVYNSQMWTNTPLRVASTLHERAIQGFFNLKQMDPSYYEQLVGVMPEVETHFRYYKEMDKNRVYQQYPHSFDGIRQYIVECLEEESQLEAIKYVNSAETFRNNNAERNPSALLGGLPILHVFRTVLAGGFVKAVINPVSPRQEDLDYEA